MKTLDTLTGPSHITYIRLKRKSDNQGKMPSIKSISKLLSTLGIEHRVDEVETYKYGKPSGFRYYTFGGERLYKGHNLVIPEIGLDMDSTETYYSHNTWHYASRIIELIEYKSQ